MTRRLPKSLGLPLVALGMTGFMGYHLYTRRPTMPNTPPAVTPAASPFPHAVAGSGVVEARGENIAVGSLLPGVVSELAVHENQTVAVGDLLFRLDDRQQRAELAVREAERAAALARLRRLEQMPRPEEIPVSEARVRRARAELVAAEDLLERRQKLVANRMVSEEELVQRRQAVAAAHDAVEQAEAEDQLLKAGAWKEEIAVAAAEVARAESLIAQIRTELDRLEIRAPVAGVVLRVDLRLGEYVGAPPGQPLVVLGDVSQLHVRVDVDEEDIPRFVPEMPGQGFVRGNAANPLRLRFVRIVPLVVPKRTLTGAAAERVDTRVLQVIYAVENHDDRCYVGQQLDVFLQSPAQSTTPLAAADSAGPQLAHGR